MDKRTWTGLLSNALHRKFFVINIIMTYCALAAHLCFMQTIVLSPYMTTFMALAKDYGSRMTKCVLTATRTREVWSVKLIAQILAATNHWFCFEIQAFLDFQGFDIRDFGFTMVYKFYPIFSR